MMLYVLDDRAVETTFREHLMRRTDFWVEAAAKGYDTLLERITADPSRRSPATFGTHVKAYSEGGLLIEADLSFRTDQDHAVLRLDLPGHLRAYGETCTELQHEEYLGVLFTGAVHAGKAVANHSHPDGWLLVAAETPLVERLVQQHKRALGADYTRSVRSWFTPTREQL